MARGKSGRVVLEIDPELKRRLYATLETSQQTMKEWFIREAEELVYGEKQPSLFDNPEDNKADQDK
ncbi:MAG: hypothetical protein OXI53_07180 [Nitrospira sp.]|nr:hypothetical protein [Nitrospira sp.]MDE0405080.1 hypothetical protein [Nitrospira sp.]